MHPWWNEDSCDPQKAASQCGLEGVPWTLCRGNGALSLHSEPELDSHGPVCDRELKLNELESGLDMANVKEAFLNSHMESKVESQKSNILTSWNVLAITVGCF